MIIDAHAHLSNTDYGNVEVYLRQMKESGVEKAVAVPGGMMDVRKMTDYVIGRAKPENPIPDNAYIQKACSEQKDILVGFACVDPHKDNAVSTLEQAFRSGLKGLKLNPMSHQFSFASKAVQDLAALCGNYGAPFYSHVLFNPGASSLKFVELARQFPRTNFILGHMGFGPADQDGLEAASKLANFYLETSTGNFLHLKEAVRRAGAGKLIYGSEFPLSHPKAELVKIQLLNLKSDEFDKVTGGNVQSLLKLQIPQTSAPASGGRVDYR